MRVAAVFALMLAVFVVLGVKRANRLRARRGGGFSLLSFDAVGGSVFNDASWIG
jgi:hypothetical protein